MIFWGQDVLCSHQEVPGAAFGRNWCNELRNTQNTQKNKAQVNAFAMQSYKTLSFMLVFFKDSF